MTNHVMLKLCGVNSRNRVFWTPPKIPKMTPKSVLEGFSPDFRSKTPQNSVFRLIWSYWVLCVCMTCDYPDLDGLISHV